MRNSKAIKATMRHWVASMNRMDPAQHGALIKVLEQTTGVNYGGKPSEIAKPVDNTIGAVMEISAEGISPVE